MCLKRIHSGLLDILKINTLNLYYIFTIFVCILVKVVNKNGDVLIGSRQETGRTSFSPKHLLDNAVANIICSMLFDKRFDYNDTEFQQLRADLDKVFELDAMVIPVRV